MSFLLYAMISFLNMVLTVIGIDSFFSEWLLSLYEEQWNRMLNVYNGSDQGPIEVPRDVFEKFACRCGRILEKNSRVNIFEIIMTVKSLF